MTPRQLELLLRRTPPPEPDRSLPESFSGDIVRLLATRESWRDVCLLLGACTFLAFSAALVMGSSRQEDQAVPELRLFQPDLATHPFATP